MAITAHTELRAHPHTHKKKNRLPESFTNKPSRHQFHRMRMLTLLQWKIIKLEWLEKSTNSSAQTLLSE